MPAFVLGRAIEGLFFPKDLERVPRRRAMTAPLHPVRVAVNERYRVVFAPILDSCGHAQARINLNNSAETRRSDMRSPFGFLRAMMRKSWFS